MRTNRILSFHGGLAPTETCHTESFCHRCGAGIIFHFSFFIFPISVYMIWRSGIYQVPYDLASVRLDDAR
jgi:hypothetical protein